MNLKKLPDAELLRETRDAVQRERDALPHLLSCLAEVERRDLHLDEACGTLFDFCVKRLGYAPGAAFRRSAAARAANNFPEIYARIQDGSLNLSSIALLSPHLKGASAAAIISRAAGRSKREVEALVADLVAARSAEIERAGTVDEPQAELGFPDAGACPSAARAPKQDLSPAAFSASSEAADAVSGRPPLSTSAAQAPSRDVIRAEAGGRSRISFTAEAPFAAKLEQAAALIGAPALRVELVLEAALDALIAARRPRGRRPERGGAARRRSVAGWVKAEVWTRDGGRCSYRTDAGERCGSTRDLQYDHVLPWALGGASNDPANIRLLCRAHNLRLARKTFGDRVPAGGGSGAQASSLRHSSKISRPLSTS